MSFRRPSPQTLLVLTALAREPAEWRHGYDLSAETGIASGTLYPILMRLGDRGYLESMWEPSPSTGRPPRHLYRLTRDGIAYSASQAPLSSQAPRSSQAARPSPATLRSVDRRPVEGTP